MVVLGYTHGAGLDMLALGSKWGLWVIHVGARLYMMAFGSNEGVGFEMLVLV